ncbi:MAG: exodeoxyribonuclease VII small subunit [Zetaproteobacteria bacterium]|nr:exodeoxyribonuclease VII small subunit [Zetaproteobacteria bacterium]
MESVETTKDKTEKTLRYTEMLASLQQIVAEVRSDSSDLDTLVSKVEQGYTLIHGLQQRLEQTKMKVEQLRVNFEATMQSADSASDET